MTQFLSQSDKGWFYIFVLTLLLYILLLLLTIHCGCWMAMLSWCYNCSSELSMLGCGYGSNPSQSPHPTGPPPTIIYRGAASTRVMTRRRWTVVFRRRFVGICGCKSCIKSPNNTQPRTDICLWCRYGRPCPEGVIWASYYAPAVTVRVGPVIGNRRSNLYHRQSNASSFRVKMMRWSHGLCR